MKIKLKAVVLCFLLLLGSSSVFAADFEIPGTGDGVGVLKSISAAYFEKTNIKVDIPHSIGSGGGVVAAGSGKVELARVARGIKAKEKSLGLEYLPIFDVPTVFFVNPSVDVNDVTAQNILDIFSGKIDKWSKVGGQDVEIKLYVRERKDSSYNNLKKTFSGFDSLKLSYRAIVAIKTPYMVNFIKNDKHSIGFGPLDVALENGLKVLKVNGISATDLNYPYFGTIGLVYKKENLSKNSKDFIGFLKTPEAKIAIQNAGGVIR